MLDRSAVLHELDTAGPEAEAAAEYIRAHGVRLGFKKTSVGAFWSIDGNIYLNEEMYNRGKPTDGLSKVAMLCLIVHEAQHLKQGVSVALSVYGELEAWQIHWRLYERLAERRLDDEFLVKLLALPLSYDRTLLREARTYMKGFDSTYRGINLLPLYPSGKEIAWWITRRVPQ
jgi:hypothetical protein